MIFLKKKIFTAFILGITLAALASPVLSASAKTINTQSDDLVIPDYKG